MIPLLPRESNGRLTPTPEHDTSYSSTTAGNVLVIDDSPDMLITVSEALSMAGYRVLAADSGERGIEIARQHCPQLVLCDLLMEDLDGFQVLKAIRDTPALATVPVILISAHSDKENVRRGMDNGADDFLGKPFNAAELISAVQSRLSKQAEVSRQTDRRLDKLRGHLSMTVPHEFRTPLQGIVGLAELIQDRLMNMSPEEVLESARSIHQSAKRLHRVIENFLVYSQIEGMSQEAKDAMLQGADGTMAAHEILAAVACASATRYQRVQDLQLQIGPATIRIDPDQWRKIIEEVIDNAFKFSQPEQRVAVELRTLGGMVLCSIADGGRGFKPDDLAELGPHRQFERETFEQQGAGLGLIIAKRLTELLGGEFQVQSIHGQGTQIRISFPLSSM